VSANRVAGSGAFQPPGPRACSQLGWRPWKHLMFPAPPKGLRGLNSDCHSLVGDNVSFVIEHTSIAEVMKQAGCIQSRGIVYSQEP
jgi:hypothetical protein